MHNGFSTVMVHSKGQVASIFFCFVSLTEEIQSQKCLRRKEGGTESISPLCEAKAEREHDPLKKKPIKVLENI